MKLSVSRRPGMIYLLWKLGLASAQTETTQCEQECLRRHAHGRRRLVEIGVWHGVNTRSLRTVMADDGILYAVDPFVPSRFGISWEQRIAHGEVNRETKGQVQFLRMTSAEAATAFKSVSPAPPDFVFLDGDHSYGGLATDWKLWSPQLASGGIIAVHDSRSCPGRNIDHTGPARFTRDVIVRDPRFAVLEVVDSLTVVALTAEPARSDANRVARHPTPNSKLRLS